MKNSLKKAIAVLLVVLSLCSVEVITVSATPNVPYSSKGASIATFKTSATAYIKKCTCSPVDNHLEIWIRVQYKKDGNYYWDPPGGSTYYCVIEENANEARKKVSGSGICYADGMQYARCGSGTLKQYDFAVSK